MSRAKKMIAASLVLVAAAGAVACGHRHHAHSPEHAKKFVSNRVDDVLDRVDATAAQKTKIHAVKDRLFAEYTSAHAGSQDAKKLILAEWKSDNPDADKLHALADARVAAYQKAIHETIDGMIEVHATLDKEQRAEITAHAEKHMQH